MRRLLIQQFLDCFAGQLEEVRATKRFRPVLRVRKTGLLISVVMARFQPTARTPINHAGSSTSLNPSENEWQFSVSWTRTTPQ